MRAQLVPLRGGRPIQILRDVTLVGRQEDLCDVCIDQSSISKLHCLIVRTDGLLFIRDLGSTNGTKVNGQRVIRGALLPGDELAFAGEKFRVEMGPGEPDAPPEREDVHGAHTEVIELPERAGDDVVFVHPQKKQQLQTASDDVVELADEDFKVP